jgi:hypothetical protein
MARPLINRTPERIAISAALNAHLERTGVTQDRLADDIGIPRLSLINYRECRQTPLPASMGKLKAFFGQSFPSLPADASSPPTLAKLPASPTQQSFPFDMETFIETQDSLVSARLTRRRPNVLELTVEIRKTGSD